MCIINSIWTKVEQNWGRNVYARGFTQYLTTLKFISSLGTYLERCFKIWFLMRLAIFLLLFFLVTKDRARRLFYYLDSTCCWPLLLQLLLLNLHFTWLQLCSWRACLPACCVPALGRHRRTQSKHTWRRRADIIVAVNPLDGDEWLGTFSSGR
jgi:hypothetical protein